MPRLIIFAFGLLLISCGSKSNDFPRHMISTENPLPPCPSSPNCVRVSVPFEADSVEHLSQALSTSLDDMNAFSVSEIPDSGSISAVFRIPVFGWKDDVSIQITEQNSGTIVHIRSASRVGYYDLGVNKRRVKKLIRRTNKNLLP